MSTKIFGDIMTAEDRLGPYRRRKEIEKEYAWLKCPDCVDAVKARGEPGKCDIHRYTIDFTKR